MSGHHANFPGNHNNFLNRYELERCSDSVLTPYRVEAIPCWNHTVLDGNKRHHKNIPITKNPNILFQSKPKHRKIPIRRCRFPFQQIQSIQSSPNSSLVWINLSNSIKSINQAKSTSTISSTRPNHVDTSYSFVDHLFLPLA